MPVTGAGLIGLLYYSFPFSLVSLARSVSWHYMKARHVTSPCYSLALHSTFTLQTHSSLNSSFVWTQEVLCWLYLNQPRAKPLVHSCLRVCLLWFSAVSFGGGSCWGDWTECGSNNKGTCLCCSLHPFHMRSLKLRFKLNRVVFSLLAAKRKVNSSPIRSGGKCFTACLSNKYSQRRFEWGNAPGLKCNFTSKIQAEIPGNAASLWLWATCYFPATPFSSLPTQSKPKQALASLERSACFPQPGGAESARLFPHGVLSGLVQQRAGWG